MFSPQSSPNVDPKQDAWSQQLDQFSQAHQTQLAALAWGFLQQFPDDKPYIGIDLQPTPHFISCEPTAIAKFNDKIDRRLNELVGILAGHDPATEVAIFVITPAQFKLIFFQPKTSPEECFQELGSTLETLQTELENALQHQLKEIS